MERKPTTEKLAEAMKEAGKGMNPNIKALKNTVNKIARRKTNRGFDMGWFKRELWCGTTCCVAGQYILDNPRSGLEFAGEGVFSTGCFQLTSEEHLAHHFNITVEDARSLFISSGTRKQVVKRFRKFFAKIKKQEKI